MVKTTIIFITAFLIMPLSNFAFANGMSGHLYTGKHAVKKLKKSHGITYKMLSIGTSGHPTYFRTGLLLPDALMKLEDHADFAHSGEFLNVFMNRLIKCKKDHGHFTKGNTHGEVVCAKLYAQFFGVVGHIAADVHHDEHFMKSVYDAHKSPSKKCVAFTGLADNTNGCKKPKKISGGKEQLSCLGVKNNGKEMEGGSPGAQWFTDVAIDFVVYPGIATYVPSNLVARNYQISNMTHKMKKVSRVDANVIKNAIKKYKKDLIDRVFSGTTAGGSQAANICSWGVDNHIHAEGGLKDTSDFIYKQWDKILKIIHKKRVPKFEVDNGLDSKKFEVTEGNKF